jgi:vitamin B12 transporter
MALAALAWSTATALAVEPQATELVMDRIVVTASGWETRVADTAPSITVISEEEIERKRATTVAELLREVPGLEVSESGSRGALTNVFLRGAESDQVLVLVDGVEVNSTTTGAFDFADLTPENVERIEVLRGFGGVLYGSEAVGGVIQIFTRRGEGPPRGSVSVAGGNGSTHREVAETSGRSGIFSYSASASHLDTNGFHRENDDYENTAVSARLSADVARDAVAWLSVRTSESDFGNLFNNNFLAAPDPNARQNNRFLATRGEWDHSPASGLRYRVASSYARQRLEFEDRPDPAETGSLDSDILSETLQVDGQAQVTALQDAVQAVFGIEWDRKAGDVRSLFSDPSFGSFRTRFDEAVETVSGYTLEQLFLAGRRLVLTAGVRVDGNDRFGREVSPAGGASYSVASTGTRFRTTYAEAFKAPSLNELFFPGFGNPDLDAETSWEVDAGVDQPLGGERWLVSATYFHREVSDLIEGVPQPDGLFRAQNVGQATVDGAEGALSVELLEGLRVGGQYTFLDIDAEAAGRVRRPKHRGSVFAAVERESLWQSGDRVSGDLRLLLVGQRDDFDPVSFRVRENDAYQRVDLTVAYGVPLQGRWATRLEVFGRIENLLDRDYREVLGFGARPVNFLAGLRVAL